MVTYSNFVRLWEKEARDILLRNAKELGLQALVKKHMGATHFICDEHAKRFHAAYNDMRLFITSYLDDNSYSFTLRFFVDGYEFPLELALNNTRYFMILFITSALSAIDIPPGLKHPSNFSDREKVRKLEKTRKRIEELKSRVAIDLKKNRTLKEIIKEGIYNVTSNF